MEAVKAMREGKIATLKGQRYHICDDKFGKAKTITDDKDQFAHYLCLELIEATDWEIVEDKKKLSDKWIALDKMKPDEPMKGQLTGFYAEDVKQALKEFIDGLSDYIWSKPGEPKELTKEYIKKVFGERLIQD